MIAAVALHTCLPLMSTSKLTRQPSHRVGFEGIGGNHIGFGLTAFRAFEHAVFEALRPFGIPVGIIRTVHLEQRGRIGNSLGSGRLDVAMMLAKIAPELSRCRSVFRH